MNYDLIRNQAVNLCENAFIQVGLENYAEAITLFQQVIQLSISIPAEFTTFEDLYLRSQSFLGLGLSFYFMDDFKSAISAFEEGLRVIESMNKIEDPSDENVIDTDFGYICNQLADCHHRLGNNSEAKHYNDKALEYYANALNPIVGLNETALDELTEFWVEQSEAEEMHEILKNVLVNTPVAEISLANHQAAMFTAEKPDAAVLTETQDHAAVQSTQRYNSGIPRR